MTFSLSLGLAECQRNAEAKMYKVCHTWCTVVKLVKPIYNMLDLFIETHFNLSHYSSRHELEINY